MKDILILKIWQHRISAIAVPIATLAIFLWPAVPLGGIDKWMQFFYAYFPQNYFYVLLSILSGLYAGIYVYNRTVVRSCSIKNSKTGATASVTGVLLGACPACIPALAFFLPLSISILLSSLSLVFLLVSIAIMIFAIYRMNGFTKLATASMIGSTKGRSEPAHEE